MRPLSPAEGAGLVRLARAALERAVGGRDVLERVLGATDLTPSLREPRDAFVTLRRREPPQGSEETLRGCIGSVGAKTPLYQKVVELAGKAALEDPRFSPVRVEELPELHVEVSVLTESRPLAGSEELVPGRHGVELTRGTRHAVFLPQVAAEHGWSAEELLRQLSLKAGLAEDAWHESRLAVFESQTFGEER